MEHPPRAGRTRLLAAAAVVGVVVAAWTVAFLAACQGVTRVTLTATAGYHPADPVGEPVLIPLVPTAPFRPWLLVPVAALGGLAAGWVTQKFAPEAAGPGVGAVVRDYRANRGRMRGRVPGVKVIATALTVGTGGSGGREGPMVQIGAGVGAWLAGRLGFGPADRRLLLAAGVGAGVSSAFRTPLAGTLFAAEVLSRSGRVEGRVLIPAGTAAVAADVAGLALGWGPLLPAAPASDANPAHLVAYAVLTVAVAALARAYVAAYRGTVQWAGSTRLPRPVTAALGAGLAALIGVAAFEASGREPRALAVLGFGLGTLQDALVRPEGFSAGLLLAVAAGKLVATCLTVGTGGSGGVFGPALVIGGCGGGAVGLLLQLLGPVWAPPPAACVVLGMAGFFAAAAKTPFSTLVIVCELTGDFSLLTPALGVCVGCFVLSGPRSLFRGDAARCLLRGHQAGRRT